MSRGTHTLRLAVLLALGALAVHHLRYLAGYGEGTGEALRTQGHAYLQLAAAVVAAIAGLSLLRLLQSVVRARRTGAGEPSAPPLGRAWALSSIALTVAYSAQELLEGRLSAGHASGLHGIVGHGGWSAVPIALAIALLVALALRGAGAAVAAAARRSRSSPTRIRHRPLVPTPPPLPARPAALARHLAARAPPVR